MDPSTLPQWIVRSGRPWSPGRWPFASEADPELATTWRLAVDRTAHSPSSKGDTGEASSRLQGHSCVRKNISKALKMSKVIFEDGQ